MAGEKQQDAHNALQQAMAQHQQGHFAEAKNLYKYALKRNPKLTQAYNLLGVVMMQTGHIDRGIDYIKKALKIDPHFEDAHINLGNGYRFAGRLKDAVAAYSQALKHNAVHQDALNNRALAYQELGQTQLALADFKHLISLNDSQPEFYFNLGTVLSESKSFEDAVLAFEVALELDETAPVVLQNYAQALHALERHDDALSAYDKALAIDPHYTKAWVSKGLALMKREDFSHALQCFEQALVAQSDLAIAQFNKGHCLLKQGHYQDAISAWSALHEHEKSADFAVALAQAHAALGHLSEAQHFVEQALSREPAHEQALLLNAQLAYASGDITQAQHICDRLLRDHAGQGAAKSLRASCALVQGDFARGWADFAQAHQPNDGPSLPQWRGEDIGGKTLYIDGRGSDGEVLLLARFVSKLAATGAKILFAPAPHLHFVLKSLAGVTLIKLGDEIKHCDLHTHIAALPLYLGHDKDAKPDETPYLTADSARVAAWRAKLGAQGCKIAVAWRSDQGAVPSLSGFDIALLKDIAGMEHVRLISLHAADETAAAMRDHKDLRIEACGALFDKGPDAYADAAAVMECCDLVISADHTLAHLAGALARPVWLALPAVPHWPWMRERNDSPFYPTAALFHAHTIAVGGEVFGLMRDLLSSLLHG
jgi:tetratricopeptide (TPR) repeat protein